MIIRQLKQEQYESLCREMLQKAHICPMEACRTVHMTVNGVEYALRLQPESRRRIAVLQACRIQRENGGPHFELITRSSILSSLLDILVFQGIGAQESRI